MAQVFISYASKDRALAAELSNWLGVHGFTAWWDISLVGGESFRKAILVELSAASVAIVIWTDHSVDSDWVCDEASRAHRGGKLVPIRLPSLSIDLIPPPFGAIHTLLWRDWAALQRALARFVLSPDVQPNNQVAEPLPTAVTKVLDTPKPPVGQSVKNTEDKVVTSAGAVRTYEGAAVDAIRKACQLASEGLNLLSGHISPGTTTSELDDIFVEFCERNKAVPGILNYRGFPKSLNTSLNHVVVHGIPNDEPMKEGDIIKVAVCCKLDGFYGKQTWTFPVGQVSGRATRLMQIARVALAGR
jgi:hypothetical protein